MNPRPLGYEPREGPFLINLSGLYQPTLPAGGVICSLSNERDVHTMFARERELSNVRPVSFFCEIDIRSPERGNGDIPNRVRAVSPRLNPDVAFRILDVSAPEWHCLCAYGV